MKTVRVYDFETKELTTMPERELSSDMIAVQMQGIDGLVYVDQRKLKRSAPRHKELPQDLVVRVERISQTFADVMGMSMDEWLEGFRRDLHPDREIAIWERIAQHYARHTTPSDPVERRKEVVQVLLACSSTPGHVVQLTMTCKHLSREDVARICDGCDRE